MASIWQTFAVSFHNGYNHCKEDLVAFTITTPVAKLGFTAKELEVLSPRAKKLTRGNLLQLATNPQTAPAELKLTFQDLQGLHNLATTALKKGTTTGGGGSGDGGIRCCCCIACCCCCCAVAVKASSAMH